MTTRNKRTAKSREQFNTHTVYSVHIPTVRLRREGNAAKHWGRGIDDLLIRRQENIKIPRPMRNVSRSTIAPSNVDIAALKMWATMTAA